MFYIEGITAPVLPNRSGTPAKAGFDNLTNGFAPQGPPFNTIDESNVIPDRSFNDGRFVFEEVETTGRGPRPHLQRAKLPGMPSEYRHRRLQSDHGTPDWPYR